MAHFAKINEQNLVEQVVVVHNEELLENGVELESKGIQFCQNLFGGNWVQTSYNGNFRKNYAGIGYLFDTVRDAFIPPIPNCHPDKIILDENSCLWTCSDESHNEVSEEFPRLF